MNVVEELKAAIERLRLAAVAEGIEPGSTLGVWLMSQEAALLTMGDLVEEQTRRIEERADLVWAALNGSTALLDKEVARSKAAVEEMRAATVAARAQAALTDERRKAEGMVLAQDVAKDIKTAISATMVIREVRWNRVQHGKAALLAALVLLAFFVGGTVWSAYRRDHATLERCFAHQVPDTTGKVYCPMDVVGGNL